MLGDYESLEVVPYQFSVSCHSITGVVWEIDASELRRFKDTAVESYNELKRLAKDQQNAIFIKYIKTVSDTQFLLRNSANI